MIPKWMLTTFWKPDTCVINLKLTITYLKDKRTWRTSSPTLWGLSIQTCNQMPRETSTPIRWCKCSRWCNNCSNKTMENSTHWLLKMLILWDEMQRTILKMDKIVIEWKMPELALMHQLISMETLIMLLIALDLVVNHLILRHFLKLMILAWMIILQIDPDWMQIEL